MVHCLLFTTEGGAVINNLEKRNLKYGINEISFILVNLGLSK